MDSHEMSGKRREPTLRTQLGHVVEGLFALTLLYSFVAHVINQVVLLITNGDLTGHEVVEGHDGVLPVALSVRWGDVLLACSERISPELCKIIYGVALCWATAVVLDIIFEKVCGSEWVQESVSVVECWEEVTWNPWSWVEATVCSTVEVLKWVLQWICRIRTILIWGTAIVCVIVVLVLVLA